MNWIMIDIYQSLKANRGVFQRVALSERQDAFPLRKARIASGASFPGDSEAR
ncbi:MAG: hypothetical protein R6U98_05395 [Pirellulaceae bacterium]